MLLLDVDCPWADATDNEPRKDARIFVVDTDPLKRTFGWSHVDAEMLCAADAETALTQLLGALHPSQIDSPTFEAKLQARRIRLDKAREERLAALSAAEARLAPDGHTLTVPFILGALRSSAHALTPSRGAKVLWLSEAASCSALVWDHIGAAARPGSMFMSGGTALGWVLGACVGASIGARADGRGRGTELVVGITGDGNFLFGAPTAAYWVARRYGTPFLMVVLNNRGWAVRGFLVSL